MAQAPNSVKPLLHPRVAFTIHDVLEVLDVVVLSRVDVLHGDPVLNIVDAVRPVHHLHVCQRHNSDWKATV